MDGAKILIVEDDEDLGLLTARRLRRQGYEVAIAYDGLHAIAAIKTAPPDLILLDLGLHGADGYRVLESLRDSDLLSELSVVVVSSFDPTPHAKRALAAGAIAFMQKPVAFPSLLGAIRSTIASKPFCFAAAPKRAASMS